MNQGSNHLFDQEHQERHISIKYGRTFYNLARNLSKQERKERWWLTNLSEANFLSCLRKKSLQTDHLSSYEDDDDDDYIDCHKNI